MKPAAWNVFAALLLVGDVSSQPRGGITNGRVGGLRQLQGMPMSMTGMAAAMTGMGGDMGMGGVQASSFEDIEVDSEEEVEADEFEGVLEEAQGAPANATMPSTNMTDVVPELVVLSAEGDEEESKEDDELIPVAVDNDDYMDQDPENDD
ncbi:expressed unknown protein [Seminavis robusta]|uniref:Uncharacterized protein n=1 Tax=Seminavis robusta TaxID=568900 RepID=A0A9N8HRB8_9STRA|nr:expressed unknown protein [Seminavis robusta]|eukprot:Sro1061_g236800.1 n/a (150) ;mRNA; f:14419-15000